MMVPSLAAKEIPEGAAGPDGLCADGLVGDGLVGDGLLSDDAGDGGGGLVLGLGGIGLLGSLSSSSSPLLI